VPGFESLLTPAELGEIATLRTRYPGWPSRASVSLPVGKFVPAAAAE
jgi:hypothetical protein